MFAGTFTPFSARYWHINKSFVPIWFQFRWKSLRLSEVYALPKGTFGCHTIVWIKTSNVKIAWQVRWNAMAHWTHLTKKTAPLSTKHCIPKTMCFRKLLTFSRVVMLHFCSTITSWFVLVLFRILLFIYVFALYVMSTSIKSGNENISFYVGVFGCNLKMLLYIFIINIIAFVSENVRHSVFGAFARWQLIFAIMKLVSIKHPHYYYEVYVVILAPAENFFGLSFLLMVICKIDVLAFNSWYFIRFIIYSRLAHWYSTYFAG